MKLRNFIFAALFLGACELKDAQKIEKSTLQMSENNQNGNNARQLYYDFGVRYDSNNPDPLSSPLRAQVETNDVFREKYLLSMELVASVFNKPVSEFPSVIIMNQRIMEVLNEIQNPIAYQEASNYFLCLAIRGYFKRLTNLTAEHKNVLSNYLDILVAQKNMELEDLTWGIEQMNGVWSSSKIKQTAQTILAGYEQYAIASGLKNSLNQLNANSEQPNHVQYSIPALQDAFNKDNQAIPILQNMAN